MKKGRESSAWSRQESMVLQAELSQRGDMCEQPGEKRVIIGIRTLHRDSLRR